MSPEALGIAMLALMVVAILIGFPTAFTLMSLGVTFGFLGMGFVVFDLVVQRTFFVMQNDVLVSIPLFLFMGYLVERAGIVDKLFKSVQLLMGGLPGALAIATLLTGALFATATGIVGASVTLLGLLALPAMIRRGTTCRSGVESSLRLERSGFSSRPAFSSSSTASSPAFRCRAYTLRPSYPV